MVLGTSHGRVTVFDIRGKPMKNTPCVFKGFSGAVTDIATSPRQPSLAYSVSLDRYLRVHDLENKDTVRKVRATNCTIKPFTRWNVLVITPSHLIPPRDKLFLLGKTNTEQLRQSARENVCLRQSIVWRFLL